MLKRLNLRAQAIPLLISLFGALNLSTAVYFLFLQKPFFSLRALAIWAVLSSVLAGLLYRLNGRWMLADWARS